MRLPNDSQRLVIVGRTGSGKTRAGIWHLSNRNFNKPWLIFDYKRDDLIAQTPAIEIGVYDKLPQKGGLYVVRPNPTDEDNDAVESMLLKCWEKGNIGLYFDEGFMVPAQRPYKAMNMILTQGRSLRVPCITLSQRPVELSRFVFSEADFFQLFDMNDIRDRKTVGAFMPSEASQRIPQEFCSWYYDVGKNDLVILSPVPSDDEILSGFDIPKKKAFYFL